MNCAIVVPNYKSKLNELELISLRQVFAVLGKYDIYMIAPRGLEINFEFKGQIKEFDEKYFINKETYSSLMLDVSFYQEFEKYDYILIYQLDAFVFKDEMESFCRLGYDYIGSPWLYGVFYYINAENCIWRVGNGGFSLRKVSSFIRILNEKKSFLQELKGMPEDYCFSFLDAENFRVAPENIALEFSYETQVKECFINNNGKLPFGCHAWEKYNLEIWKPYIESYGYRIDSFYLEQGNQDKLLEDYYKRRTLENSFWKDIYSAIKLKKTLREIFNSDLDIYSIWGYGKCGKLFCCLAKEAGLQIEYIIDSDTKKVLNDRQDCRLVSPSILDNFQKKNIIITLYNECEEIENYLNIRGLQRNKDYFYFGDILKNLEAV